MNSLVLLFAKAAYKIIMALSATCPQTNNFSDVKRICLGITPADIIVPQEKYNLTLNSLLLRLGFSDGGRGSPNPRARF